MGYCMVTFFYSNGLTILQESFRANAPRSGLAMREFASDFLNTLALFQNISFWFLD